MPKVRKPVDPALAARRAAYAAWHTLEGRADHSEERICFGVRYFTDKALAEEAGRASAACNTYNGGWFDGMACGRDSGRDYVKDGVQYYAVTC